MKKSYFLMAAAAAMFAACSETELVNAVNEAEYQKAIGFDEFLGKSTRGLNTTELDDFHDGFGVWAFKGDAGDVNTLVMDNFKVVENGAGKWVYDGQTGGATGSVAQVLKYWDKLKSYEFYAYAPYNKAVKLVNKDLQIVEGEYAANENLAGTTLSTTPPADVTYTGVGDDDDEKTTDWMVAATVARAKDTNDYSEVQEVFAHTMSRLIVNLKSDIALTVNSVSVNNVYGKGSYANGKWSVNALHEKSVSGAKGAVTGGSVVHYCMEYLLIPSEVEPSFSIEYVVNGDTRILSNAEITGIDKFEAGKAYEVTVTIGNDPIEFTANVTAWGAATTGGVTIN